MCPILNHWVLGYLLYSNQQLNNKQAMPPHRINIKIQWNDGELPVGAYKIHNNHNLHVVWL